MNATEQTFQHIRIEHEENLSWIVLNRPDRANAMSDALLDEFSAGLELLRDTGGPVLAVRGEGKGFSGGYDISEVGVPKPVDPVGDRDRLHRNVNRFLAIWDHPKPVIAAVHGYCVAGATQLCVFADITLVADDVRIGEPTVPIGGGYIAPLWAPVVGAKRAKELAFVPGNWIDAETAVRWGWANHAVPAGELLDRVRDLAGRIALTPPEVLRVKKLSVNRAMEAMGVKHAASAVAEMDALLHLSPSVIEVREQVRSHGFRATRDRYAASPTFDLSGPRTEES